uniref:Centrobin n=1 Tax=Lygus hesperus TaxID=30085 RepID=A0A0K8T7M8_LYGHE
MSDTDDTDTLLLVPPNLFTVPSESEGNLETSVVEDLITHVERLETRVNTIENRTSILGSLPGNLDPVNNISNEGSSHLSFESSSIPTFQTVYPAGTANSGKDSSLGDKQYILGEIDRYLESINTTSMENNFEEAAMNKDSGNERVLDRISTAGIGKNLALPDVDKLLREMESTQNEIERKLRERESEYGIGELSLTNTEFSSVRANDKGGLVGGGRSEVDFRHDKGLGFKTEYVTSRRAFILGENVGSVPDLGLGVRDLYAKSSSPRKSDDQRPVVEEPIGRRDAFLVGSSSNGEDPRNSNFTRSPMRGSPQRVPLNLETRKPKSFSPRRKLPFSEATHPKLTGSTVSQPPSKPDNYIERTAHHGGSGDSNDFPHEHMKNDRPLAFQPKPLASHFRGNLMSLADLWKNESNHSSHDDPSKLRQKLEEEKFRRMHLEETIQSLNKRVLEEQEKLAVAMVVDEGKDKAIIQITEAWKQMVEHWKKIEADRHSMSQRLISEKAALKRAREDVDKKIERWEKEVSQALDLAAGYKNKCVLLEVEFSISKESLEGKVTVLEEKLKVNEKTLTDLLEERKFLSDKLQSTQEEVQDGKRLIDSTRKEVESIQQNLSTVEAELAIVKEQRGLIEMRLMEEKGRVVILEQQKSSLEDKLEEAHRCQMNAEKEAKNAIAELESSKMNLREFYQNQLEMVVRSKLTEFQGQLDAAQLSMQAEIESTKEMAQKRAEEQHNSLVNSHVAEIRRLEAIHKDELRSLELKLVDSERRRLKLENNHKDIAQKLHGVMENQWQQALSILTSEISLRQPNSELCRNVKPEGRPERLNQHRNFASKPGESESSEDTPFNKDDLVTCRSTAPRPQPSGKQEQLLKYIHMLLEKPPGKAVESSTSMFDSSFSITDVPGDIHQEPQHQPAKVPSGPNDPGFNRKPPWKPQ